MVVGPTTTNCIPGLTPVPQGPQAQAPSMWEPIWDLSCDAGFQTLEATITTATSSVPPPLQPSSLHAWMHMLRMDSRLYVYIHTCKPWKARRLFRSTHWCCSDVVFCAQKDPAVPFPRASEDEYIHAYSLAHVCAAHIHTHAHICISSMHVTESKWREGRGPGWGCGLGRDPVSEGPPLTVASLPVPHSPQSGKSLLLQYLSPAGSGYK